MPVPSIDFLASQKAIHVNFAVDMFQDGRCKRDKIQLESSIRWSRQE